MFYLRLSKNKKLTEGERVGRFVIGKQVTNKETKYCEFVSRTYKKETHKNIFSQLIYWLSNTEYSIKSCTQQNTLWMLMFYPLTVELKKKKEVVQLGIEFYVFFFILYT